MNSQPCCVYQQQLGTHFASDGDGFISFFHFPCDYNPSQLSPNHTISFLIYLFLFLLYLISLLHHTPLHIPPSRFTLIQLQTLSLQSRFTNQIIFKKKNLSVSIFFFSLYEHVIYIYNIRLTFYFFIFFIFNIL